VLQVSNKAECFILATEPHRPAARMWMPADLRSKLLHFHTSCHSSCLTDQHLEPGRPCLDMAYTILRISTDVDKVNRYFQHVATQRSKEVRHKERFFVASTPDAQTRRLPRLVHLLFRPLPHFCLLIGHILEMVCFHVCTTDRMLWAGIDIDCGCCASHGSARLPGCQAASCAILITASKEIPNNTWN
jgi:hypothetical protein